MRLDPADRLPSFSPLAKLFVGLFTTLMLLVCLWAVWIYTVSKGQVDENNLPSYLKSDNTQDNLSSQDEIAAIGSDSETVLAPVWDSAHAGKPERLGRGALDTMEQMAGASDSESAADSADIVAGYGPYGLQGHLRHNLGLAHTHVNGQTLLFFALGTVFLFTSVKLKIKRLVLWTFAACILAHAIGLSGEGYHWFFDDILALSGLVMLLLIAYMCLMIYVDLGRTSKSGQKTAAGN
jgi:hypothetical protein